MDVFLGKNVQKRWTEVGFIVNPMRQSVIRLIFAFFGPLFLAAGWAQTVTTGPTVSSAVLHDTSPPLRQIPPPAASPQAEPEPRLLLPRTANLQAHLPVRPDTVIQSAPGSFSMPAPLLNFDGIGNGVAGFSVGAAPPDPNMTVGPNHLLQIVNTDLAIYNKTGTLLLGPIPINTLWQGFGGICQTDNDGDPLVRYDAIANRFLVTQFAIGNPNPNYLECVAVSQTPDPTGAYYRYAFGYSDFDDYPKIAVWPDAYYTTYNMFDKNLNFQSGEVCALDRNSMLQGLAATQQCFQAGVDFGGLLPSDFLGGTLPSAGAPNHVVALGAVDGQLAFWNFHVDWTNSANSTLTGPTVLTTAAFTLPCGDTGGTCVPQQGTSQQIDTLGDRIMYRLAYRNFGTYESLITNHTVDVNGITGVRWYELRLNSSGAPSIFQQGTYAPSDGVYRWMGSIAMDKSGNMAVGYSASSGSIYPQIRYAGRLASDPLNLLPQNEVTLFAGAGSQTGASLTRWGDYTSMDVDPADGCTFWYTNQYLPSNGAFNWRTRIGSFKFPNCSAASESKSAGDGQSVAVGQVLATALQVTVKDANQNPVQGAIVTFTAPGTGPSGTFVGSTLTATAMTTANGVATAPAFTANNSTGAYSVTATVNSSSVSFLLTNTLPIQLATVSVNPSSGTGHTQTFSVIYTDQKGSVRFAGGVPGSGHLDLRGPELHPGLCTSQQCLVSVQRLE